MTQAWVSASKVWPIVSGGSTSMSAMRCAPRSTHSCTALVRLRVQYPEDRSHDPACLDRMDISLRRAGGSDARIQASARLLPDPCLPPFSKNSRAIWEKILLIEEVSADEVGVASPATQQFSPMSEDLA